jgi:Effector Associated Constant Component 1
MEQISSSAIQLIVSDQSQLTRLRTFLSWAAPEVSVRQVAGHAVTGELGAQDALEVLASGVSGGGLVTAIRVLPAFLRSRRSSLEITTTVKGKLFKITATNIDEVMPILERLLDD